MRILLWLLRVLLFIVLLGFAIKNSNIVQLRFFFDANWQLPLVSIMLIFFAAGVVVALAVAALPTMMRQRREILRLKREAQDSVRP